MTDYCGWLRAVDSGKEQRSPMPRARSEEVGREVNITRKRRSCWCWVLLGQRGAGKKADRG